MSPRPSARLAAWRAAVERGLAASDRLDRFGPPRLAPESVARLRALGYAE